MITLDPLHPHQSAALEILAKGPHQSLEAITDYITKEQKLTTSRSSLYRLLGQLLDAQMIVKEDGKFSLNYMWAAHIQNIAATIEDQYFSNKHLKDCLTLEDGEHKNFFAPTFRELDPIWNHLLIAVKDLYPGLPYWSYNSDTYHMFAMSATEKRLSLNCQERGGFYFLIGNDNFLNRKGEIMYQETGAITMTTNEHPFIHDGYFLWVCGDYIVEVTLPRNLAKYFRLYFDSTNSMAEYDQKFLENLFDMKIKCKLVLRRNKKEAAQLTKVLQKMFT